MKSFTVVFWAVKKPDWPYSHSAANAQNMVLRQPPRYGTSKQETRPVKFKAKYEPASCYSRRKPR